MLTGFVVPRWHSVGVHLRYKFRLYPDAAQRETLARSFGCARMVFNDGLRLRQQAREASEKHISDGELSRRVITEAKLTPEREWLGEVSSAAMCRFGGRAAFHPRPARSP